MIDGTFQHQDSIGGGGLITNGSTQWMTAGSGILHIERPPEQLIASGGLFHGIQLWVNLPAADKWIDPRYQGIEADNVLLLTSPDGGALVRVIAGDVAGHARPRGDAHADLAGARDRGAGRRARAPVAPPTFNALVYVLSGSGSVGSGGQAAPHRPAGGVRCRRRAGPPGGRGPGVAPPGARRADPRRPADRRARLRPRALRHEHPGRDHPGLRGLPGGQARARSRPTTSATRDADPRERGDRRRHLERRGHRRPDRAGGPRDRRQQRHRVRDGHAPWPTTGRT